MILFPKFDLVCGFLTDYLHNILLGIMKLLLDSKRSKYSPWTTLGSEAMRIYYTEAAIGSRSIVF